jgi:hypothetical protein
MTTLEQVEKLREKANVSYDEAKAALEATNGDMLEALIYLEKQGKVSAPAGGGYYSSQKTDYVNPGTGNENYRQPQSRNDYYNGNRGESFSSLMKKFGRFCMKIIRKGNTNYFEVLKGNESKAQFPVTVLVLLLVFAFWVTIPLLIVGLFFGLRYRFNGPDFNGNTVNDAMNSAADAAESLKNSINNSPKQ